MMRRALTSPGDSLAPCGRPAPEEEIIRDREQVQWRKQLPAHHRLRLLGRRPTGQAARPRLDEIDSKERSAMTAGNLGQLRVSDHKLDPARPTPDPRR